MSWVGMELGVRVALHSILVTRVKVVSPSVGMGKSRFRKPDFPRFLYRVFSKNLRFFLLIFRDGCFFWLFYIGFFRKILKKNAIFFEIFILIFSKNFEKNQKIFGFFPHFSVFFPKFFEFDLKKKVGDDDRTIFFA